MAGVGKGSVNIISWRPFPSKTDADQIKRNTCIIKFV
jgi:hypothetical protein